MHRILKSLGLTLLVMLITLPLMLMTVSAVAQSSTTATIKGVVNDEAGNVFPGATITATNTATGFTHSATSGSTGDFTLSGPGGSGKTRVGLRVTAELAHDFADGSYIVMLAPVRDLSRVASTIAGVLGLQETGAKPIEDLLIVEVSTPHLDDVVRLDDRYGRTGTSTP